MKIDRRSKMLEIISKKEIETQEELAQELRKEGFNVTQATVSRDIKNLQLIKVLSSSGRYKYVANKEDTKDAIGKLVTLLSHTILSVENIDKMVVVRTITAAASTAAEAIDQLDLAEIAGTIAGDNTIFMMVRSDEMAVEIVKKISELVGK
ncbi:arginine repressor [Proteiniclasticum sp. SCR006]|uniref:Arginine repressor n=1 Tax=Proteiniclasticum aestuarii TaxID=2817862 RepID=A0A939H5I8_9CLOT|nr:arginine repressor [Proteiniclasticum aestuarii]MBO1263526.1 arginine repressor [Proteiniclasticum aestuarii]